MNLIQSKYFLPLAGMVALLGVSACELIASVDRTKINPGTGGFGAAPVGGGGTGGTEEGGGGSTPCDPAQCPSGTDCQTAICDAQDDCALENKPADTACTVNDEPGLCDANGTCIPDSCTNGVTDPGETDDDCGGPICPKCDNELTCAVDADCKSNNCGAGDTCEPCVDGGCLTATFCDPTTDVCEPAKMPGDACTTLTGECASGFCVEGVCCDSACGDDCGSCLMANTGDPDGTCSPILASANVVCRPALGLCDIAESCDGTATTCPSDAKSTAQCRISGGICDPAENCDGTSNDCPPDLKEPNTTVCRIAAGDCDAVETCDGTNNLCPVDVKLPNTTVCRMAAGPCDDPESCDGANNDCPADVLKADGAMPTNPPGCGNYRCDGAMASCPTSCTGNPDCVPSTACTNNECL